jgi:3-oxoacyl-[acyl-carrier protein] reductase
VERVSDGGDRVALVTGAAAGIGRAEAVALARAGHDVAVMGFRDLAGVEQTAALCRDQGRRALVVRADVRQSADVRAAVQAVADAFGRLDVLVANAGLVAAGGALLDLDEAAFREMVDSHLTGTFLCIKHAAPLMMARGWGRIVTTSSIHGRVGGRPQLGAYGAAKAGIIALTRTAARELGPHGVTVNAVAPGFVLTERLSTVLSAERRAALARQVPVGRLGTTEEIAAAVVFLASDGAAYVNGAVLDVNGGRTEYVFA